MPGAPISRPALVMALAGALALAAAMGIGRFAFTPVLPMMLDDAGLSIRGGSGLAAANYAGYLAGALWAGTAGRNPGTAIRHGLAVIALSTLLMALPLGLASWMVLRFSAGVASAQVLIAVSAWSLHTFAALRRPALPSIVFAGVGAGIAVAGLVCAVLLLQGTPSWMAWGALGMIAGGSCIAVWPLFREAAAAAAARSEVPPPFRWSGPTLLLASCYGAFGFGYIIPATYLPALAKDALADPNLFAWAWPIFGSAAAVSTLLVMPARRMLGNAGLLSISYLVMAAGVAMPAVETSLLTVSLSALCVGGTFMVLTFTALEEARHMAPDHASRLIAAMTAAFAAGQIAGPLAVAIAGKQGMPDLLIASAGMLALSGAVLGKRRRNPGKA